MPATPVSMGQPDFSEAKKTGAGAIEPPTEEEEFINTTAPVTTVHTADQSQELDEDEVCVLNIGDAVGKPLQDGPPLDDCVHPDSQPVMVPNPHPPESIPSRRSSVRSVLTVGSESELFPDDAEPALALPRRPPTYIPPAHPSYSTVTPSSTPATPTCCCPFH